VRDGLGVGGDLLDRWQEVAAQARHSGARV
jgi:hypothetical protein